MSTKLMQERGQCVDRMRSLLNTAEAAGRDLAENEQTEYNAMEARQAEIARIVNRSQSLAGIEAEIERPGNAAPPLRPAEVGAMNPRDSAGYKEGFNTYARRGLNGCDHRILNALQVGTNSEGGYIVPTEFETQLTMALQDINEIRRYATVINTASTRNIPVESSLGAAAWTAEEAAYTDADVAFSQVVLGAHKAATICKVSEELLQDAFFNVESYLAGAFGKRFGILEEAAFVAGDGSGKPTGIVPSSGLGVTAAGAAAITTDEIIGLYHSLGRPYRARATWMMADATAMLIRKLKDSTNQYLWQPGLQAGQPDTLLGRPVLVSSSVPAATTGLKSMVFGDLSYYTIADRSGVAVQRLNELYAANGQVGFRAFKRTEGKVTLAAAFKHLIQA
jgi:HK97 family phage major capsid protein